MTYEEIVYFLSRKYKIGEIECERIVNSEFKFIADAIREQGTNTINVIKLGKFTPVKGRIKYKDEIDKRIAKKESNTDNTDTGGDYKESLKYPSN